jgi:zinc protease
MEADRMTHSFIAKKDLDSEMTVVRNEYESGENSPFGVLMKRMQSVAYDWHSYGRSTIGNRSDIENVRIANLQAFYRTWYQPDNAVLLVAGKFDHRPRRWLDQQAVRRDPEAQAHAAAVLDRRADPGRRAQFRRAAPGRRADRACSATRCRRPARRQRRAQLRLHHPRRRADRPPAQAAGRERQGEPGVRLPQTGYAPGLQYFGAVVKKGEPIEPVRAALTEAVEGFAKTPPTEEEMERTRAATRTASSAA